MLEVEWEMHWKSPKTYCYVKNLHLIILEQTLSLCVHVHLLHVVQCTVYYLQNGDNISTFLKEENFGNAMGIQVTV